MPVFYNVCEAPLLGLAKSIYYISKGTEINWQNLQRSS